MARLPSAKPLLQATLSNVAPAKSLLPQRNDAANSCSPTGEQRLFALPNAQSLAAWNLRSAMTGTVRVGRSRRGPMAHSTSHKVALLAGAALGALGLTSTAAEAGGFFIHEQSTYFQGTSFAGTAAGGPSLSSMFWNPATTTQQGLGLASETDAT